MFSKISILTFIWFYFASSPVAHECLMDILVDLGQDIIVTFNHVEQHASLTFTSMFCRQT